MSDWRDGYLKAVEEFLMENGTFVSLEYYGKRISWDSEEIDPNEYDSHRTVYGWSADWRHADCGGAVMVDMGTLRERSLSQFQDTFTTNDNEVGLEVRADCACGKYQDKWLRWTGSITDILPQLLGITVTTYYG